MAADRLAFTEGQDMTEEQISATDFHTRRRDQVLDFEMSYVDMGQGDPIRRPFHCGGKLTACYESTIWLSFLNRCRYTLLKDDFKRGRA
jgi:hypothetical protein